MYNYPQATFVRDGSGAPNDAEGVNSEYYIDRETLDIYLKLAGVYSLIISGKGTPQQLEDSDAPNNLIYYSLTGSKLSYKDPAGVVHALY